MSEFIDALGWGRLRRVSAVMMRRLLGSEWVRLIAATIVVFITWHIADYVWHAVYQWWRWNAPDFPKWDAIGNFFAVASTLVVGCGVVVFVSSEAQRNRRK